MELVASSAGKLEKKKNILGSLHKLYNTKIIKINYRGRASSRGSGR